MNNVHRLPFTILLKQIRYYSRSTNSKNHYKSLGISPKSTQGEVKTAYYQLSKVYHPDKNQGNEEYARKFRDITEAYEVLGNTQSRKLYDRGLNVGLSGFTTATPREDDTPLAKFHKSRATRSKPPTSGRTPIYDFDEWSKNHYGHLFRQNQENMKRSAAYKRSMEDEEVKIKLDRLVLAMFVILIICMMFSKKNYDNVAYGKKPMN